MEPIRLNTKAADRCFLLSLALSILINAAVMAALSRGYSGLEGHVFHLLSMDDETMALEIGDSYSLLPAAPRYASAIVVGEDRIDLNRYRPRPDRLRPAESPLDETAAIAPEQPDHQTVELAAAAGLDNRENQAGWNRDDLLDAPDVRLSPEKEVDANPLPIRGGVLAAPVIIEERYVPSGYAPLLERARPGAVEAAAPAAMATGERSHEPVGEESGVDSDLVRETPFRHRFAIIESPGVYVPVDALEVLAEIPNKSKPVVWLVEEKRFEPPPGRDLPAGAYVEGPPDKNNEILSPLPVAVSPVIGETPEGDLPRIGLSRRPALLRDRFTAETPPPETRLPPPVPVPVPEPEEEPEPIPETEPEAEMEAEVEAELETEIEAESPEPEPTPPEVREEGGTDLWSDMDPELGEGWKHYGLAEGFALVYPQKSLERGETGIVVVEAVIDAGGRVQEASIYRSSGFPSLDAAALETVRKSRFTERLSRDRDGLRRDRFPIVFALH